MNSVTIRHSTMPHTRNSPGALYGGLGTTLEITKTRAMRVLSPDLKGKVTIRDVPMQAQDGASGDRFFITATIFQGVWGQRLCSHARFLEPR